MAITNESGVVTDRFEYDAYGRMTTHTGDSFVIFGYNGRDGVVTDKNGLIYMRARYYSPELCRFVNADLIHGDISHSVTLNRYAYANGNPVSFVDPFGLAARDNQSESIWSLKNDEFGIKILLHWLYGGGEEYIQEDGTWGNYMNDNTLLQSQIEKIVTPIADSLDNNSSIEVDITTSMEIENGEDIIGYQYLHGTNQDVGGFQIKGTISKDAYGNVTYDLTYTWNDIIDPNFMYESDSKKAKFAEMIPFADPTDYIIRITWSDVFVVKNASVAQTTEQTAGNKRQK